MSRLVLRRRARTPLAARKPVATPITAAGARISDPSKIKSNAGVGSRDDWTARAWAYVRAVGELDYYVRWRSNAASRARLVPVAIDPHTLATSPIPDDDPNAALIAAIVRDIGGPDQPQILKRFTTGLTVPGETWVACITLATGIEKWFALSGKEISKSGSKVTFKLPDGTKHEYDEAAGDFLIRIWDQDEEEAWKTRSPVRSNIAVLNEITRATATIDNAASSRLLGQGLVLIDDSVNLPRQKAPAAARGDDTPEPEPDWDDSTDANDLQDLVYDIATQAIADPTSLAALMPIFATVTSPGKIADTIHHQKFENTVPEVALKTRESSIRRLALGLEVSPERLLGMSVGNHWTSWLVSQEDVTLHIMPVLEIITNALTEHVLRPALEVLGLDARLYGIGVDATQLTQDPDRKAEAFAAAKAGAISNRALRGYTGFPDEDGYDLSTVDGWIEWAQDRVSSDPTQLPLLWPILALQTGVTLPAIDAPAALPAAPAPADDPAPVVESEPVDSTASAELLVTMCVRRALELAGKRMRTRENQTMIPAGCPPHEFHRHLTPAAPGGVFRLIEGWETIVDDRMLASVGADRAGFRRLVEARAVSTLSAGH